VSGKLSPGLLSEHSSGDVPIANWSDRGAAWNFALSYDSSSTADPALDSPDYADVDADPDFAHLDSRNSHWTHSFSQFVEVVQSEDGEHAVRHQGGVTGFKRISGGTWQAEDSFHSLTSSGTSSYNYSKAGIAFSVALDYGCFDLTDGEGTHYVFDSVYWETGPWVAIPYFRLSSITDRWNRTLTLTWNGAFLQSVKDGNNRGLTFTYVNNIVRTITDPFNRTHTLLTATVPDENGINHLKMDKVTVTGPGSPTPVVYTWRFGYGTVGNATDPLPYGGTYTGDLVVWKQEPTSRTVYYTYEPVTLTTAADGTKLRAGVDDWTGRLTKAAYTDNSSGGAVPKTITRSGTTLTYPEGNSVTFGYADEDLTSVHDNVTGREIHYSFDAWHNPLAVWTNAESASPLSSSTYTYDTDGRTIKQVDTVNAAGEQTTTTLGSFNLPTESTAWAKTTGGQPYNQVVRWAYDLVGNPTSVTQAYGTTVQDATTLSAYSFDNPGSITESVGRTWSFQYDAVTGALHRTTSPQNLVVPVGHPDRAASVTTLDYGTDELPSVLTDALGRQVQVTYNAATAINTSSLEVTYTRPADGSTRKVVLDAAGRPIRLTDEAGVTTSVTYDGDGQPITVVEAFGTSSARTTRYTYNKNGDLLTLVPPRGTAGTVTFEYNRYLEDGSLVSRPVYEGQVTRLLHPDGTQEYFGYFPPTGPSTGELCWKSEPYTENGATLYRVTRLEHDALHRPFRVTYPASGSQPGFTVETAWDEFGRVSGVTDASGTTTYTYDALDRLTAASPSAGRKSLSRTYTKDLGNQRWSVRTDLAGGAGGVWQAYEDTKGRVARVISPYAQTSDLTYNALGQPLTKTLPNGALTQYAYDSRNRLASVVHQLASGAVFDRFDYGYDAVGRVRTETDLGARVHQYTYDLLGQLTDEQHPDLGPLGSQYAYDLNGIHPVVLGDAQRRPRVLRGGRRRQAAVDEQPEPGPHGRAAAAVHPLHV
jgi:YD repeat-containing protein